MDNFFEIFGMTMGQLVTEYRAMFAWVAPVFHIATLILLYLVFRYGNRYRKAFTIYFIVDTVWMVVFVGGWFCVRLYQNLGPLALAPYGATPVLLLIMLYQWVQELRRPRLDLDFTRFDKWRLLVGVPAMLWGFWYPPYEWGVRLIFDPKELLFGAYGLMGCPTTLLVLGLLFLKYPSGNRPLFSILTVYAVCIGAAMVALQYIPDIPFFVTGLISLGLIGFTKVREIRKKS